MNKIARAIWLKYTIKLVVFVMLALALPPNSALAESDKELPPHLHRISNLPQNKLGHLYDETVLWCAEDRYLVKTPGPLNLGWTLTKNELTEHLKSKTEKASLLVLYFSKRDRTYPVSVDPILFELEKVLLPLKDLGYKRIVVAGFFGPPGGFGPYYAYDTDDDVNSALAKKPMY
ncbi:MAG: hypothetical protein WCT03_10135 [Candidatus Obscuribacterales bacterium]